MKPSAFIFLLCFCAGASAAIAADDVPVDFARDVRPILSAACFKCHGPDEKQRQGDLRLDTPEGALAREAAGPFVPGKPDVSEALRRMTSEDPAERMPPADSGKTLTSAQIGVIRRWVAQGAKWSSHWAFTPPQRSEAPKFADANATAWVRNPIDAFVLARLHDETLGGAVGASNAKGESAAGAAALSPAPEADRLALLRRLSLDLIGLPPTLEEIDAFLADTSQEAYDRTVTRLLDSPHYGERWGRQWLDAARYADSDGYEKDKSRQVWFYRDWVIDALNRDLPYDQFIIEQIAGDLLPNATQDQRVATGFLRNSMINEEGGVDPEQFRMEAMFDRIDAIGKSVLGLTIQCAQCHNHKFDPLTQREYYGLFAFINDAHEANIAVYTPEQQMLLAEIVRRTQEIEADLQHRHPDWADRMAAWEEAARGGQPQWTMLEPNVDEISTGGQKYLPLGDGSLLAQGYAPTKHRVKITARTDVPGVVAFRLELLTHPDLPRSGPGRSVLGTAALTEFQVDAAPADAPDKVEHIKLVRATSDIDLPERPLDTIFDDRSGRKRVTGPIAYALDGKDETAWSTDAGPGQRNQPRQAVFVAEKPVNFPAGTLLTFYLQQNHGGWNSDDNQSHNLGRMRLSATTAADATADPVPAAVREVFSIPRAERSPRQVAAVFSYWRTTVPEWQAENAAIEAEWRRHPNPTTQLVLTQRSSHRTTHRLDRGDFLKPLEAVEPSVPSFLHPMPAGDGPPRLKFARWLADRASPTTARSIVNRVWQSYFGVGLVSTSEDLGVQSEAPSHPELLDWLAVELMDQGWRLKPLHRLIVMSSMYRQSSRITPEAYARDPYNRLLARGPRFRVEAELVRDVALAASGLLNEKIGGPSVYPPAPDFLFQPPTSYGPKVWHEETGDERYRRALYTFRYRSVPYPVLQTFDAPNGDFSCVRRSRSNTPLQALVTLNEPLFMECAQALALRTLREGGSDDASRLAYAFRRCLSRPPSEGERQELLDLLAREMKHIAAGWADAKTLAHRRAVPPDMPPGTSPTQLAGWTLVSRVILNLDETISKE